MKVLKDVLRLLSRRQNIISVLLSVAGLLAVFYLLNFHIPGFIATREQVRDNLAELRHLIERFDIFAYPVFIGLYFLLNSLLVPVFVLSLLGGLIFDPLVAILLGLAGMALGTQTYFWLSKFLRDKFLNDKFLNYFGSAEINRLRRSTADLDFRLLLYLRLNYFFPIHPADALCGTMKVSFTSYLSSTVLGLSPRIVIYSFLGTGISRGGTYLLVAVLTWIVLIVVESVFGIWHLNFLMKKGIYLN